MTYTPDYPERVGENVGKAWVTLTIVHQKHEIKQIIENRHKMSFSKIFQKGFSVEETYAGVE